MLRQQALKTNGNSAPIKPMFLVPSSPEAARRRMTTPAWSTHPPTPEQSPKKKQKPTPLVPSSPEAARRRMTTPVVNTPPDTGAIPQRKPKPPHAAAPAWEFVPRSSASHSPFRNPPQSKRAPPSSFRTSFRASGRKISGISAARRACPPPLERMRSAASQDTARRRG